MNEKQMPDWQEKYIALFRCETADRAKELLAAMSAEEKDVFIVACLQMYGRLKLEDHG